MVPVPAQQGRQAGLPLLDLLRIRALTACAWTE
jgi:hypothetical protein